MTAPAPLPVPDQPVGGERMGDCGVVVPEGAPAAPETTAASWVVQDLDSGDVIAAKDPHARERPASLIKTLLALVVVTELKQDQVVTVTKEDAEQECTCVGIVAGGRYTVNQLLHGLLMHSGNDVAHAFATALGGVDSAVQKMNAMAATIGATDTRAATPSGLDGPGMSTSAYDLSLIFNHAMKQQPFADAVGTKAFQFPAVKDKPAFAVFNDNKLLGAYPGFLGGKTGFTDDARHTYVGGAAQGGKRLAVVLMRAEQRPTLVVKQASALLDYGFALSRGGAQKVGEMVQRPVGGQTEAGDPAAPGIPEGSDGIPSAAAAGAASTQDPFGPIGWIITLVVVVAVIAGFVIGHQRKKTKAGAE